MTILSMPCTVPSRVVAAAAAAAAAVVVLIAVLCAGRGGGLLGAGTLVGGRRGGETARAREKDLFWDARGQKKEEELPTPLSHLLHLVSPLELEL